MDLSDSLVRAALTDRQKMHRLLTGCFQNQRSNADILFCSRIKGLVVEVYLYSSIPVIRKCIPSGIRLAAERDVTFWLDSLKTGMHLSFQIETAPFKKVAEEGIKNSRRRAIVDPEERISWLERKAQQSGFVICTLLESKAERIVVNHSPDKGGRFFVDTFKYTGTLQITDGDSFQNTVKNGLGPGKAYGLGMLLLA